jgi:protein involved in polysaccharide export with SLBB domain
MLRGFSITTLRFPLLDVGCTLNRTGSSSLLSTRILFSVILFLFACQPGLAQTRAQLKAQAEAKLKEMSPEEIDKKLKEYGISREDAIRKAKELNISLEEFLSSKSLQLDSLISPPTTQTPLQARQARLSKRAEKDTTEQKKILIIPGLSDRKGVDSLQPYGFDIFELPSSTFEPVLNLASPPSYLLGPGDEIVITVWGETKLNYQLQINREGNVVVPDVGPVSATGSTIGELKQRLLRRMASIYSGLDSRYGSPNTFLDVSLSKLRVLQVFVLGEVVKPGGYSISSFSTAFNALYLAGGPTVNGTMRQVQVVRKGTNLPPIDLYDYIIRGDNSKDLRLQDGDIVFVKPAAKRVAMIGSVVRPAIYEVKEKETLGDLVGLAGGLRFDAYFNRVHIERVVPFDEREKFDKNVLDTDVKVSSLTELQKSNYILEDGDVVSVFKVADLVQNRVSITGNVNKPGRFELKKDMRVRDLILEADSLLRNTFSERGTLFRMLPNLRKEIRSFNPRLALERDPAHSLLLQNEDSLVLYKESQFFPQQTVSIGGAVRNPGPYPRNEKMTLADLVVLAGGLKENASTRAWEVSRLDTSMLGKYSTVFTIDVTRDYWNTKEQQAFQLQDFDFVFVPVDPRFTQNKLVKLSGYVMSPGLYTIRYEGERVAELIRRAGGLRPGAYLEGSRFVRKMNETGIIPTDFKKALDDTTSRDNVVLNEGDSIHVAFLDDVVYVYGEVFVPSAILYKKGESVDYYIKQAGGFKQEADESRVAAFLPNGKKWESGWFFFSDPELLPGSTVTVPKIIEKEDKTLPLVRDLATILASLAALTVAVVQITK